MSHAGEPHASSDGVWPRPTSVTTPDAQCPDGCGHRVRGVVGKPLVDNWAPLHWRCRAASHPRHGPAGLREDHVGPPRRRAPPCPASRRLLHRGGPRSRRTDRVPDRDARWPDGAARDGGRLGRSTRRPVHRVRLGAGGGVRGCPRAQIPLSRENRDALPAELAARIAGGSSIKVPP